MDSSRIPSTLKKHLARSSLWRFYQVLPNMIVSCKLTAREELWPAKPQGLSYHASSNVWFFCEELTLHHLPSKSWWRSQRHPKAPSHCLCLIFFSYSFWLILFNVNAIDFVHCCHHGVLTPLRIHNDYSILLLKFKTNKKYSRTYY